METGQHDGEHRRAMKRRDRAPVRAWVIAILLLLSLVPNGALAADALASWNDGPVKTRITAFVGAAVDARSSGYIPAQDRIAVFDNDGTLWSEQPLYFQFQFALDRVRALAPQHPEWKTQAPFKAVLNGDREVLAASGEKGLAALLMATHTGMTTDQFAATVTDWLATARHPRCRCPYTDLVYQPMLELLSYLRANGFKTYIVSGGTVEFMRTFAESVYGVPPEQVIGSTFETKFWLDAGGKPALVLEPKLDFLDDGLGKPVAIGKFIGRRPVFAFGNSDGDQQMLEWTAGGTGPHFEGLVHHTDAAREVAYDRASRIGRLYKALDEASARGWALVDMQRDWRAIYPRIRFEPAASEQATPVSQFGNTLPP